MILEKELFQLDHFSREARILDLGCGEEKKVPWAVGVDRVRTAVTDVVHDLDVRPWPFPDDAFDVVVASHVVQHIADLAGFLEEVHRVARPGAEIRIAAPHYTSPDAWADPSHRHALSYRTAEFFAAESPSQPALQSLLNRIFGLGAPVSAWYGGPKFDIVDRRITFRRIHRMVGLDKLAAQLPLLYEYFLGGLAPARDLQVILRVRKP